MEVQSINRVDLPMVGRVNCLQQTAKAEKAPVEEAFSDPMLVFCNISNGKLDQLLTAMGRAGLPRIALKAMLTPTNRSWTSQQLWTELRREHEAMQAQPRNKK